ncbi:GroES-like protein [Amniculicola lignicola CBS 123094]|uniref:GroES-like protein n=1 Tax=Amniculicola lignicola CBS 123094 TaxID=1392246 RepID=A0A6A5X4T8_9PLEO|nr:GroES-like protein [Amniculicola lignicola CBS 123094]
MPAPLSLPPSFKSLTYTSPSTPPHLTHAPLPSPSSLGPKDILVKIHAAAINPVDIQLWGNAMIGWVAGKKEKGIGRDYSGIVVGVGDEVRGEGEGRWEVGEEVWGLVMRPTGEGTFSQYVKVTVGIDPIARKPKSWTFEEAAAVPLVALTAFTCLDWLPAANSDGGQRRVIVAGASGGTGIWCVQLAKKLYNCHVTGICSAKNADFVRNMGADEIIDYTSQDIQSTLLSSLPEHRKYDLYIDCVGGTSVFNYWTSLLHRKGAYVTIVGDKTSRTVLGGPITYLTSMSQILRFVKGWVFGPRYANVELYTKTELLEKVLKLEETVGVKIVVQDIVKGILDEDEYEAAWEKIKGYMEGGRVRGKIVVALE